MEKEYTVSVGMKILYVAIGAAALIFAVAIFYMPSKSATPWWFFTLPLILVATGVLIIINVFKRKIIVGADTISSINVFSTREMAIASIKGYRASDKYIIIEPLSENDKKLTINNYTALSNNKEFIQWIKNNFKDLDAVDLANEEKIVLQDVDLGANEDERKAKLNKYKNYAKAYNIAGAIIAIASIFFDNPISATFLLVYPLIGIIIIIKSKGFIKFFSNAKRSVYPNITLGFFICCMVMLINSFSACHIFQAANLSLPAFAIAVLIFAIVYKISAQKNQESVRPQLVFMIVLVLLYGFVSTVRINCVYDNSQPEIYKAAVLNHHISHGRHTSYYLTLSEWGPRQSVEEESVGSGLYSSVNVGDSINIVFKKGLLNIPWFIITR